MKLIVLALVSGFLIFLQGCGPKAQEGCGFVQNSYSERISWRENVPVDLYLHQNFPEKFVPAVLAAAQAWEKSFGRPLFHIITDARVDGPRESSKDGQNVIYFMDSWEPEKSTEQARTVVYWVGDLIKEADIRINGHDFTYYEGDSVTYPAVNMEAILIHEMGHVLGLKHKDGENSVMATYLASNVSRVNIANTDVQSLKCEY